MVKRPTPRLDKLFARLRRLTKARGAKVQLADKLGVAAPRIFEWLNGDVEPGGETTLQLLEWVTAAEAQQKEEGTRASTRMPRKTRASKSSHEKAKSDRPKG